MTLTILQVYGYIRRLVSQTDPEYSFLYSLQQQA
jgi:hypothetical protein